MKMKKPCCGGRSLESAVSASEYQMRYRASRNGRGKPFTPRAQPWWRLEACTSLGLFLETPLCFIAYAIRSSLGVLTLVDVETPL